MGAPDMSDIRFRLRARHIYDWRDPTQLLTDVRTWKPSSNPVVISEFLLNHARAPAQFSPGDTSALVGPGLDWAARYAALGPALTAGANVCDELVDGKPRYACGGVASGAASNWLPKIAAACGGEWVQTAAGSYLRPGYLSAPVMALPVSSLQRQDADVFDPWQPPDSAINTVRGQYPEPANGWEIADVSAVHADSRTRDGMDLVETLDLSWVTDRAQANRIVAARARLESAREQREVVAPFWAQELEYGDVITLDDPILPASLAGAWWACVDRWPSRQPGRRGDGTVVAQSAARRIWHTSGCPCTAAMDPTTAVACDPAARCDRKRGCGFGRWNKLERGRVRDCRHQRAAARAGGMERPGQREHHRRVRGRQCARPAA
jgi:hypothetical protein